MGKGNKYRRCFIHSLGSVLDKSSEHVQPQLSLQRTGEDPVIVSGELGKEALESLGVLGGQLEVITGCCGWFWWCR